MAQYMMPMAPMFAGMQTAGLLQQGNVQWIISPQERSNYDTQFNSMNPVSGFLHGDQARSFFMQSNLPRPVLGQIWNLADITNDGKMDKLEFAIAMKLIKLKLQGVVLPMTLPPSLMQSYGSSNLFNGTGMVSFLQPSISGSLVSTNASSLSPTSSGGDNSTPASSTEWSIPKQSKLKYTQLFNQNDRQKAGYLTSIQSRSVLSSTALPKMTLAKIWQLSDVNDDGRLTLDEFILAMHLADMAKAGNPLPSVLPQHLIPPSYRAPQSNSVGQLGLLTPLTKMDPNTKVNKSQETSAFATFEDKRRDNFQKGNLELERRRLALLESQQKEKERREKKEREEREKREKERMEQERKRQEKLERQLERHREAEREREEQRRKAIQQKEAAQREMERQRQLEWERLRRKELLQHKLREQELTTSLRAKTKTLDVELSSHKEKRNQLQERVKDVKARLMEHTKELQLMNEQREKKQTLVQKQQYQMELYKKELNDLHPEKQSLSEKMEFKGTTATDKGLQVFQRDCQSKIFQLQRIRTQLQETESRKSSQSKQLEQLNTQLNQLREDLNKQKLHMENMNRIQQDKLRTLQEARRQKDITLKSSMEEKKRMQEKLATAFVRRQEAAAKAKQEQEDKRKIQEEAKKKREKEENKLREEEVERKREEAKKREDQARRKREGESKRREEEARRKREEEMKRKREEDLSRRKMEQAQKLEEERKRAAEEAEKRKKQEEEEAKRREEELKKAEVKRKIMEMQEMRKQKQAQKVNTVDASTDKNITADTGNLVKYKALYDFTARNPDELSIKANDVIMVDTSLVSEPDWLAGSVDGRKGWFPSNYVEKITDCLQPALQTDKPNKSPVPFQRVASLATSQQSAFSAATKKLPTITLAEPPEVGQRFRAIYSWHAKKDDHLSFDEGDIVAVSEKQDLWWFGHCKGQSGWFPKSYVKDTTSTTPVNPASKPASPRSSPLPKRKALIPSSGGTAANTKFVASYEFPGSEAGDLRFNAGDVITVTNMDGEWWTGDVNGKSGIFPANYVTPYKPEPTKSTTTLGKPEVATVIAAYQASSLEQLSLQVGQIVSVRKKNDNGWWEGELQARGKKKQVGWFPANYVRLMSSGSSSGKATPASVDKLKAQKQNICRVIALYDYSAQNSDELTFERGSTITVEDKSDPDWWKGTVDSASGLFPSNYVQEMPVQKSDRSTPVAKGNEYNQRVMELISSEETYLKDLQLADEAFQQPLRKSGILTEQECNTLFVNLNDLIMISANLVKAFRVRCKMHRDVVSPLMVGDILCEQLPHLHPYIRFCSCQLNASTMLQEKLDSNPDFKTFVKKCESGDAWKGLPVSSYLVKPMQRVTKYPLLIKKIIENTNKDHPDHSNLTCALEKAEDLCVQVNEGVRSKENSDRLEWLQTHVQLDGLNDKLVFNSKTNCLDQRKFLHCGTLHKHKSNKELVGFLFNDFLLLTTPTKPLSVPANDKLFTSKSNPQFRMYKQPIFLNEVMTHLPNDSTSEEPIIHLSHIEHLYILRTETVNERTSWVNKIKEAADNYIETQKKKREKAYQARNQRSAGIGRLVVTIVEGCNLVKTSSGRHDPYCEVTMGEQSHTTKTVQDTLNPKWGSTMQFFVRDINQDVLCISVFQRDMFSPDDFLGRTEVKIADIQRDVRTTKGPITRRLLLHEVDAGEVVVKLDLLLFENNS